MTILATTGILSSLACALLVAGGFALAVGSPVSAFGFITVGAGWLGIIQAGLLRLVVSSKTDSFAGTQMEPGGTKTDPL